jgi:hypothetical protein
VIEVAVQNEHLLSECQFKNNYKKCTRCNEAINVLNQQENDFHFKTKQWYLMNFLNNWLFRKYSQFNSKIIFLRIKNLLKEFLIYFLYLSRKNEINKVSGFN